MSDKSKSIKKAFDEGFTLNLCLSELSVSDTRGSVSCVKHQEVSFLCQLTRGVEITLLFENRIYP